MSERGTFMTSYLYDYPNLVPVLRKHLSSMCRGGILFEMRYEGSETDEKTRGFYGLMHGGYHGEEAHDMGWFIEEVLLKELPEKHGQFSITVTPEYEDATTVFSIKDRECKERVLA